MLETLAKNEGWIVTVDMLREALWSENPFGYLVGIHDDQGKDVKRFHRQHDCTFGKTQLPVAQNFVDFALEILAFACL